MEDKIVVTFSRCVQIGVCDYGMHRVSKVFSKKNSIEDFLEFAKEIGIENPTLTDLTLSYLEN